MGDVVQALHVPFLDYIFQDAPLPTLLEGEMCITRALARWLEIQAMLIGNKRYEALTPMSPD